MVNLTPSSKVQMTVSSGRSGKGGGGAAGVWAVMAARQVSKNTLRTFMVGSAFRYSLSCARRASARLRVKVLERFLILFPVERHDLTFGSALPLHRGVENCVYIEVVFGGL